MEYIINSYSELSGGPTFVNPRIVRLIQHPSEDAACIALQTGSSMGQPQAENIYLEPDNLEAVQNDIEEAHRNEENIVDLREYQVDAERAEEIGKVLAQWQQEKQKQRMAQQQGAPQPQPQPQQGMGPASAGMAQ